MCLSVAELEMFGVGIGVRAGDRIGALVGDPVLLSIRTLVSSDASVFEAAFQSVCSGLCRRPARCGLVFVPHIIF